jgi:aminopeptidase N
MAENPDYRIVHDNLDDMSRVTTGAGTYQKGSWVLHMLRGLVGEEAFWGGIRSYYRNFQDRNATTADFRRHMEEASGMDLGRFFQQWLYGGGMLELAGEWRYDAAAGVVEIVLDQTQNDGYVFEMPVQIGIDIGGERRVETVQVAGLHGVHAIPVDGEPEAVSLDPDTWILMVANLERR